MCTILTSYCGKICSNVLIVSLHAVSFGDVGTCERALVLSICCKLQLAALDLRTTGKVFNYFIELIFLSVESPSFRSSFSVQHEVRIVCFAALEFSYEALI